MVFAGNQFRRRERVTRSSEAKRSSKEVLNFGGACGSQSGGTGSVAVKDDRLLRGPACTVCGVRASDSLLRRMMPRCDDLKPMRVWSTLCRPKIDYGHFSRV